MAPKNIDDPYKPPGAGPVAANVRPGVRWRMAPAVFLWLLGGLLILVFFFAPRRAIFPHLPLRRAVCAGGTGGVSCGFSTSAGAA